MQPGELNYTEKIQQLAQTVQQLESGNLSFEEAIQKFEQGMALAATCQHYLDQAELKVTQVLRTAEGLQEVPLDDPYN